MGEVQQAETPPRQLTLFSQIGHRSHGGTWLLPATAYSAVLRIAAATKVAEDPSDRGDGVELSSPT